MLRFRPKHSGRIVTLNTHTATTTRWINKKQHRYYTAHVFKDILDWWVVMCAWGGINSKLGNTHTKAFESKEQAIESVEKIAKRRAQRGYTLVQGSLCVKNQSQQSNFA